jgi:hypothetical protein
LFYRSAIAEIFPAFNDLHLPARRFASSQTPSKQPVIILPIPPQRFPTFLDSPELHEDLVFARHRKEYVAVRFWRVTFLP